MLMLLPEFLYGYGYGCGCGELLHVDHILCNPAIILDASPGCCEAGVAGLRERFKVEYLTG